MSIVTLKPGLLVSLHTRLEGGVKYTRTDLDADKAAGDDSAVERWETVKVTDDPEEHARAVKVRGKCGSMIRSVCAHSAFGLLCPATSEKALDEAITEARALADAFNASAAATRISVYALKGRIAESDGEAARAISSELRELLDEMKTGIDEIDVAKIRDAANKAKKVGGMLDAATGAKVSAAIEEARSVAREIVKKATEKGANVGDFVQGVKLKAMEEARFAFLDLDGPAVTTGEVLPVVASRGLDLDEATEDAEMDEYLKQRSRDEPQMAAASGDIRVLEV